MPRLPCEAKVDVTNCHACHAKYRCRQVPRLPQRWCASTAKMVCERWCVTKLRVNERGRGGGGGGGGIQNQKQEPHTKMGNKQNTYMIIKYYKSKLPGQVCEVLRDVALVGYTTARSDSPCHGAGLLGGVGEPRKLRGGIICWGMRISTCLCHLLYSHPHPCLSGYWYCHVFVNPQKKKEPRPVKSKVQVAAAVVTCLVGIPCSSSYAAVLAGLPPCLTPLAALAALPRQSLLHWLACRRVWAVSQNKSLLQRCERSCVRWVSLLHWLLLSQVSQIGSLLPWLSCTCRLVSLLCLLLCRLTSCHVCLLLCWLTCTMMGVSICGRAAVPKCVPAALPCPAGVLAALAAAVLADLLPCLPGVLAPTRPKMAQDKRYTVPTLPKMSQHSQKWPKISPIWSQLLPNKGHHKPQNTTKMAQHKPNMVPTWPKMSQHGQKLLPNKGQHKPQNTPKWLNMSPIYAIWCRHSPQWPNISPRSGKHSLTACPKKETKTNEK